MNCLSRSMAVLILGLALPGIPEADAAPFSYPPGCGAVAASLRATTFASGLNFPYGMDRLADGSLIVATSRPTQPTSGYFATTGELWRLVDSNADGVADGPGAAVYTGLPGALTAVRRAGSLLFVTSAAAPSVTVLRIGEPYTRVGEITFQYPLDGTEPWYHTSYALEVRPTPGAGVETFDVFFNVGSQFNAGPTTGRVQVGGLVSPAVLIDGDGVYRISVTDGAGTPAFSPPVQIASGLRNAAGIAIHPVRGDLYFTDNGIDGLADDTEPLSADELNVIPAGQIGAGDPPFFGFPDSYTEYRTGRVVGGAGIQPLVTFQPLAGMASPESEGPALIAIAPAAFPPPVSDGVFVGFHGQPTYGIANEENPLVFYSFADGTYCHFVSNDEPAIGHLNGLLSTPDALFAADMASNGSLGAAGAGTGVIYQIAAGAPLVTVTATDAVATEGESTTGTLTVTRSGSIADALTVLYEVAGTASAGSDYAPLPGTLTIAAGSASAVITITAVSDMVTEGKESVIVTLQSGAGYVVGTPDATVTIGRDKAWVTIRATDPTATEAGSTTGTFTVSRTGSTTAPLTVFYVVTGTAGPGADYLALTGRVTIAAGDVSAPIVVTPANDALMERNETVIVRLDANAAYRVGSPRTASLKIVSDEAVTIAATGAAATAGSPGRFTVSRTGSTTAPLTVVYAVGGTATAGTDYVSLPGSLTIPAGARQAHITVTPVDDGAKEGPETVVVTLATNPAYRLGGTTRATMTISSSE